MNLKTYTFIDAVMYVSCTVAPALLPTFDICWFSKKRCFQTESLFLNQACSGTGLLLKKGVFGTGVIFKNMRDFK